MGTLVTILVVLLIAVLVLATTKPATLHVERSASINAPPERIFAFINDFRSWSNWSPYARKDPGMKLTLGSITAGKGAVYEWDGDRNVGQGRMELVDAVPPSKATIKLDFSRPMEAHNVVTFSLVPQDGQTRVTWAMDGPMPFMSKVMSVFMNMDTMIGKDFEVGLANLKDVAEQKTIA